MTKQQVSHIHLVPSVRVTVATKEEKFKKPNVSLSAKKVSGVLIEALYKHIQKRVNEQNVDYIMLGVDHSYSSYRKFFLNVFSVVFRKRPVEPLLISQDVYFDTAVVLGNAISKNGYQHYLQEPQLYSEVMVMVKFWLENYTESEQFKELAYN